MLCVDIDGFKPDYLRHTKYLKSLSKEFMHGKLETVLGFTGIMGTFLSGKYPKRHGIVSMFNYSKDSRLSWISMYPFLGKTCLNLVMNTGNYLSGNRFLFKLPKVPLQWMKYFDTCMKKSFAQENSVKVKTLFDMLRENRKSFVAIDWPNILGTDVNSFFISYNMEKVVRITNDIMKKKNPDFCFTHFLELDYAGHKYGTRSQEIKSEVKKIDEALERIDTEDMLFFSDTGMMDVRGEVDVTAKLGETGLVFGKDYVYFLDSTMARFWFLKKEAEKKVKDKIEDLKGGHILTHHEIDVIYRLPKNHCDMIFLADPGMIISNNFFQGEESVKAMHGWDVRHKDQKAFYLLKARIRSKDARMVDMLPTILNSMKMPKTACDGKSLVSSR